MNDAQRTTDNDGLDPEIRRFQQWLSAGYAAHADLASVTKAEARRIAEAVRAPLAAGGPTMAATDEATVPGAVPVRVRIHRPSAETALPALVYLHGGGWTFFSIATHDRLMREYAQRAGVAVVGVDYALAPEARYPVALRQVASVVAWLRGGGAPGIDGTRLALGGDSAGANLALAAALHHRHDARATRLRALVLNYGAYRRSIDSPSHRLYSGPEYLLNSTEMLGFWRDYLGDDDAGAADDPLAQPLCASIDNLRGLPPAYLAVAQCDVLHDDSIAMAERLRAAGVPTTCIVYPGTTHGFVEAMSLAAVSRRALDETAAWLRDQLLDDR
jgi:acetyl esterase